MEQQQKIDVRTCSGGFGMHVCLAVADLLFPYWRNNGTSRQKLSVNTFFCWDVQNIDLSGVSANFSLCGLPCFAKYTRVLKYGEDVKNVFITTKQDCFIRTRPHRACHPHRKVVSSAPVGTVAQVEKHISIDIPENLSKNGTQRCLTLKNGAQQLQKNKWRPCLDVTLKKV